MKLAEIAEIIGITLAPSLAEFEPRGYSIDSRTLQPGELFFAIQGEKFDGHQFVAAALAAGACAAVVSHAIEDISNERLITVNDTLEALQELAHGVLQRWGRPVIGITGSAGKTTTKELTALVLDGLGRVHRSTGNFNNAYGLPLSVLQMESEGRHIAEFDFAVLEMGMSTPGEIRRLCQIAPPDVGAVTNVSAVHLEFFDSIEGIANAKAELIEGLKPQGLAVLNADDPLVSKMRARHQGPVKSFGIEQPADVRAVEIHENGLLGTNFRLITGGGDGAGVEALKVAASKVEKPVEEAMVELPMAGRHILYNALVAAAIGSHFGMSAGQIAGQLRQAKPAYHRGEVLRLRNGVVVVDDSYNSNPRALDEMVRMLAQVQNVERRIVVAGEMLELGPAGVEMHRNSGRQIAERKIDLLVGVRGLAREIINGACAAGLAAGQTHFCESSPAAAEWLMEKVKPGDILLIKGSRGVKTELIVKALTERFELEGA